MVSEEGGGGRVLPLSDVNYDEYPFSPVISSFREVLSYPFGKKANDRICSILP